MTEKNKNTTNSNREGLNKFIRFSTLAFEMGIIIICGTFAGVWVDDYFLFETPVFTIILSLLSIFASLYLVIKQVNNANKS